MLRIFKYLKPYFVMLILLFVVVVVEVKLELAIPESIGEMVSNGIENSGIYNYIPVVIDRQTRENILSLTPQNNQKLVLKSYKKITEDKKKSKNIEIDLKNNKNLYIISNINKKEKDLLNKSLYNVFLIIVSEKNTNIKNIILKNTGLVTDKTVVSQFNDLNNSLNNKEKILKIIDNNIKKIKTKEVSNLIINNIKENYKIINFDTKFLQNNYIQNKAKQMFIYIILAFTSWLVVIFITSICSSGVAKNLRYDLFKSVINFSKSEVDKFSVSSLIIRTTNDINQIQNFLFYFLENIFFAPIYALVAFKKSYEKNIEMSWTIIIIIIIVIFFNLIIIFLVTNKFKLIQKLVDKINLIIRENLNGLLYIRAFNTQKFEEKRFEKSNYQLKKTRWFIDKVIALNNPFISLIVNISVVIVVWVSYKYIFSFNFQVGDIMVYINYVINIIFSVLMMTMMVIELPRASVSAKRIVEVLNTKPTILDHNFLDKNLNNNLEKYDFRGKLTFQNVSFKYPNSNEYVLKNISFVAQPGRTTAIIGSTGSGKTTLVNLIYRFYDVSDGEILLDKINIKNIPQKKLRKQISLAPQKSSLFKGTIKSNIQYSNDEANDKEICEVARVSQAYDFINKKQEKFLSEISQGGENISGGQRQRLSIARALIKKSKIYIFDDSFSALDFKTDFELRKALYKYLRKSSIIIIAQRVSTIINADKIIVLDNGRIVGQGTHEELLKNCKEYYEIASNQLPEILSR